MRLNSILSRLGFQIPRLSQLVASVFASLVRQTVEMRAGGGFGQKRLTCLSPASTRDLTTRRTIPSSITGEARTGAPRDRDGKEAWRVEGQQQGWVVRRH